MSHIAHLAYAYETASPGSDPLDARIFVIADFKTNTQFSEARVDDVMCHILPSLTPSSTSSTRPSIGAVSFVIQHIIITSTYRIFYWV